MPHVEDEVHDGYEQCFGETLVHPALLSTLLCELDCVAAAAAGGAAEAAVATRATEALVHEVGAWLVREQRLLEVGSGRPLTHAAMVLLDKAGSGGRIVHVLTSSCDARATAADDDKITLKKKYT